MRAFVAALVVAAALFAAAAVSPARIPAIGAQSAFAKDCPKGFVHATFSWTTRHRCLKAGQYCERAGNPQYHKYGFQCVNNRLRKQTGKP
jgi:hypothetical protein